MIKQNQFEERGRGVESPASPEAGSLTKKTILVDSCTGAGFTESQLSQESKSPLGTAVQGETLGEGSPLLGLGSPLPQGSVSWGSEAGPEDSHPSKMELLGELRGPSSTTSPFDLSGEAKRASPPTDPFAAFNKEEEKLEDPYFRGREFNPQYVLQKEEPQHRMICILAAEGYTNTEIAEKLGFTTAMIAYVKKQPWAMEYVAKVQGTGAKSVRRILTGAAAAAATVLVDAAEGALSKTHMKDIDRIKAANDILNRLFGTAPQLVQHQRIDPKELSDEELIQMMHQAQ